jgi:hypothetical protein
MAVAMKENYGIQTALPKNVADNIQDGAVELSRWLHSYR